MNILQTRAAHAQSQSQRELKSLSIVYITRIISDVQLSSIQLTSCGHPAQRLDTFVNCHLRAVPVLKLQLLVFLAAFSHVLVDPVKCIRHMIVVLSHARSITDGVGDDSAVRLNEIDLSKNPQY
jgi:hypothetical protein